MKCKKCGRELKGQVSIQLGYGPTCAKKLGINVIKEKKKLKYNGEDLLKWISKEN